MEACWRRRFLKQWVLAVFCHVLVWYWAAEAPLSVWGCTLGVYIMVWRALGENIHLADHENAPDWNVMISPCMQLLGVVQRDAWGESLLQRLRLNETAVVKMTTLCDTSSDFLITFQSPAGKQFYGFQCQKATDKNSGLHSWTKYYPFGQHGNSYLCKGIKAKNISLCVFLSQSTGEKDILSQAPASGSVPYL